MKRFEYQTLFYDQGPPAECRHLNRLGDDGWEAYATAVQGTRLTIFLKRERAKEREMPVDDGCMCAASAAKEVEITPAMIVAGRRVFADFDFEGIDEIVAEIFSAMEKARGVEVRLAKDALDDAARLY